MTRMTRIGALSGALALLALLLECQARDVIQAVENPHMQVGCCSAAAGALAQRGLGCVIVCRCCMRRDTLTWRVCYKQGEGAREASTCSSECVRSCPQQGALDASMILSVSRNCNNDSALEERRQNDQLM